MASYDQNIDDLPEQMNLDGTPIVYCIEYSGIKYTVYGAISWHVLSGLVCIGWFGIILCGVVSVNFFVFEIKNRSN